MKTFLLLLAALSSTVAFTAGAGPVQVFILASHSNMEGRAAVDVDGKNYNEGRRTLAQLLRDLVNDGLFKHLRRADGNWTVHEAVCERYQCEDQPLLVGPLAPGFTVDSDKLHVGPEPQFGHLFGDALTSQVLPIETAWRGESLYRDSRPPSSDGTVGPCDKKMIAEIRLTLLTLASLPTYFPGFHDRGHELAGFVWSQGWNDSCEPGTAAPENEVHFVNLIHDVRRDLRAPKLPVIIGELTGPWLEAPGEWASLQKAQAAAPAHGAFVGNVLFAETDDFVRQPENSPNPDHGLHEFGNAKTYALVGDALGKAMVRFWEVEN
jgi:hypothetical protein